MGPKNHLPRREEERKVTAQEGQVKGETAHGERMKDTAHEKRKKEKIAEEGIVRESDALWRKRNNRDRDRGLQLQKAAKAAWMPADTKKGTAIAGGNDGSKSHTATCGQATTSPKGR